MLAYLCHMSETHFRRLFAEYMNMAPVEYINLVRVQMACENMKKANDSMNDIAIKSGFESTSTFNRNFKRIVGTTPYQWKKDPYNYESKLLLFNISAAKGW
jgi:AraC-like DNA-binding protein